MDNKEQFINDFVAAAKENDENKMKDLAEQVSGQGLQDRVDLLETLVEKLKEEEANEEVAAGLAATLELMKMAVETQENSAVEEAKDTTQQSSSGDTKAEEATQDVAADNSADEAEKKEAEASPAVAESEGEAPTEEVKEEKSEQ